MALKQKTLVFGSIILLCLLFTGQTARPINDNGNPAYTMGMNQLPPELLRPRYGEDPFFPRDYVIGKIGRCDASEESYRYARLIIANLAAGDGKTEGVQFSEQKRLYVRQNIGILGTRTWRVGGGRVEPDGSVSFLIRFLGRENSITGELYLRKEEPKAGAEEKEDVKGDDIIDDITADEETVFWLVDDILLEPPRSLAEGKFGPSGADMMPYERFF